MNKAHWGFSTMAAIPRICVAATRRQTSTGHMFSTSTITTNFRSSPQMLIANGWAIQGLIVLQSGQPYSVVDYSGAVGSIYYGLNDGITNPIVPLAAGCTPQSAVTGMNGTQVGLPALKASCFTVPLLYPCNSTLVA